ncbi:hypothetical protein BO83DRAFT_383204 [Aspergillus eucalypticola CBS 122712]|uniref:Uncharacterized protein n=1 Tax=Aspergillus eucalypticola (strain CBS 122712 / IBT 29274) TaxID=1448314 RepID=A0A317URV9_ASPEC|nr:uncharacterized protein BO83DRAFT_383204 [Aspergillus eucalypticola CBS 122712]PWY62780.1 hypothetical protein BO83DRAFT_383204 [Aspergillus eucalypticola CBS 122712]
MSVLIISPAPGRSSVREHKHAHSPPRSQKTKTRQAIPIQESDPAYTLLPTPSNNPSFFSFIPTRLYRQPPQPQPPPSSN